jgi:exopolysaccharide biosynthesis polyprenyl glycosylphosphotransferase
MTQVLRPEVLPLSHARIQLSANLNDLLFRSSRSIFVIFELVLIFCVFVMSWWLSPFGKWNRVDEYLTISGVLYSLSFVGISLGLGQYERFRRFSYLKIFHNGVIAAVISFFASVAITYLWYGGLFGRLTIGWGAAGSLLAVTCVRFLSAYILSFLPFKFAVLGESKNTDEILNLLSNKSFRASRYFDFYSIDSILGRSEIFDRLNASPVYDCVVTEEFKNREDFQSLVLALIQKGIRIVDEYSFYEDIFERVALEHFSVLTFLQREINTRRVLNDLTKRSIDIAVSLCGLIALSPLLLLIAVLIRCTSPGPVLFVQPRQGRLGQKFNMFKFRTMTQELSCQDASLGFTKQNDGRVTGIGRILRPLHLDELPQLLNILIGQMSIVGPRPEALSFALRMSAAIPQYDLRYIIRPGLTGHAQLMVGYMMDTIEDTKKKLSYDLYYIINHSLAVDLRIITRTAFVVLKKIL